MAALASLAVCWLGAIAPAGAFAPGGSAAASIKQGYITVPDGTQLKYWVELPAATGKFPTMLAYSAYSEGNGDFSGTGGSPEENNLLANGYAVLGVNIRGTGCSGGIFDVLSQQSVRDGAEVVEWAAAQDWSNGHIGMWGNSYPGTTQLPVALLRPPHLDAIAPWHPLADDPYRSVGYPGGIFNEVFAGGWPLVLEPENLYANSVPTAVETRDPTCARNVAEHTATGVNGLTFAQLIDHPYDDGLYASRSTSADFSSVDIPALVCLDWQDDALPPLDVVSHTLGQMDQNLTWVMGMNTFHTGCSSTSGIQTLDVLDRFLARYLKGEANGFEQTPHVMLWHETQKDANNNPTPRWITTAKTWNDIVTKPVSLYLGSGNSLSLSQPSTAQAGDSYTYPLPGASTEGGFATENFAGKQTAVTWKAPVVAAGSLQYATPRLAHDTELFGTSSANLWLASSATDTDLQVTITEVRPDGQETYVQRGWLRASMRKLDAARSTTLEPYPTYAQADVQLLVAGQPTYVRVPLFAFDHVFRAGSSIRVWIDAPTGITGIWGLEFQKTPATNTILHDPQHPSNVTLGYLPGGNAQGTALPACDSLLNQPCRSNPDPVPSGSLSIGYPDRRKGTDMQSVLGQVTRWFATAAPLASAANPQLPSNPLGSSSGSYSQVGTMTGPGIPPTGPWQFDISWYDPGSQTYLLSDGTSNALDLFDGAHDVYTGQVTGFAGPTGVLTTDANTAWVGDANSTVKVVDLSARKIVDSISTGGQNEADELAYDPQDGIIAVTNPQDVPTFVTLVSTKTRTVLGRVTIANSLPIIEQPVWDPVGHVFLVPVQRSAATPAGGLISIDPQTRHIVRTTTLADGCAPFGMALGPRREMLIDCLTETLIVNVDSGAVVAKVDGLNGGDEVSYEPAHDVYAVAAWANATGPVLGIVDAHTHRMIASPATGVYSHSVAVSLTGQIYVPLETSGIGIYANK